MKRFLFPLLAAILAGSPLYAQAQQYPSKVVRVISPYPAGGSNDATTRIVAEGLSKRLSQQFIVENKPGANNRIANEFVAKSAPDGYTLLMAAAPLSINSALYPKLPYDPIKDFVPIVEAVLGPVFLVVNESSPAKTVQEFVALGKAKPGKLTIGGPGNASGPHLVIELFKRVAGIDALHVPYKGDAPLYTELLGGRIDALVTAITTGLPHIKAGKLRVLAVASEKRSPLYPDAPTFLEAGLPVVGYGWFGLVAPAGTPPQIVAQLNSEVNQILKTPEVAERFKNLGLEPIGGTPEQFGKFIRAELDKWTKVARDAKIQPD